MNGNRKYIALPPDDNIEQPENHRNYKVTIIIEKDNNGFNAFSPELQGCRSQGNSLEEVLANIREAIERYLETLSKEKNILHQGREKGSAKSSPKDRQLIREIEERLDNAAADDALKEQGASISWSTVKKAMKKPLALD